MKWQTTISFHLTLRNMWLTEKPFFQYQHNIYFFDLQNLCQLFCFNYMICNPCSYLRMFVIKALMQDELIFFSTPLKNKKKIVRAYDIYPTDVEIVLCKMILTKIKQIEAYVTRCHLRPKKELSLRDIWPILLLLQHNTSHFLVRLWIYLTWKRKSAILCFLNSAGSELTLLSLYYVTFNKLPNNWFFFQHIKYSLYTSDQRWCLK